MLRVVCLSLFPGGLSRREALQSVSIIDLFVNPLGMWVASAGMEIFLFVYVYIGFGSIKRKVWEARVEEL